MEWSIKTNTGKEYEIASCSCPEFYSQRNLFIDILNINIQEAVMVFSNPNETETIYELQNEQPRNTYTGYINLVGVQYNIGNNSIEVSLARPENEADGVWEL